MGRLPRCIEDRIFLGADLPGIRLIRLPDLIVQH
jgi:hypothetical protein